MCTRLSVLIAVATLSTATAAPFLQVQSGQADSRLAITSAEFPALAEIIEQVVARTKTQDEAGAELRFESVVSTTVDSLDGDGEVVKTETTLHHRYALEGSIYEELVARNGKPLSEADARDESERQQRFRREAREAAANGERLETNDERQVRFNDDLMVRFDASISGEEMVRGKRCWVITFRARHGKLPERTRLDKALNRSAGRAYIAQDDYGIMQIEFELLRPVRYLWGVIASLRRATGRLEFDRVEDAVWLPRAYDLHIDVRVLFRTTRQRIVREWIEHNRVEPLADASRRSAHFFSIRAP